MGLLGEGCSWRLGWGGQEEVGCRQTDRQRVWYPRQARPGYRAEWFLLGCLEGLKGEGTAEGGCSRCQVGPKEESGTCAL